jgi:hypothetical protein
LTRSNRRHKRPAPNYFKPNLKAAPLERFKKNCSHLVSQNYETVFLGFGFVSAQLKGFQTCAFAKASPKPKNPRSQWPQFFLKRSKG